MEIRTGTIERLRDALLKSGSRKGSVSSSAYRTLAKQDLLSDKEKEAMERVDAVAETMFLVIAADEQIADAELAALRGAIRGLVGDVLADEIVQIMIEGYAIRLRDDGREKRLKTIALSMNDPGEALNAFALAAAVALADDDVDPKENALIDEIKTSFSLDDEEVNMVLGQLNDDAE